MVVVVRFRTHQLQELRISSFGRTAPPHLNMNHNTAQTLLVHRNFYTIFGIEGHSDGFSCMTWLQNVSSVA